MSEAHSKARKARWAAMTQEERSAFNSSMAKRLHAKLTPEQRSANARRASLARWGKKECG